MANKANITFSKDQLEILIWIIDDWQNMKSDGNIGITYPNDSASSTRLKQALYKIFEKLE